MLSSLDDLVSPLPLSEFLGAFRDKRRLHIKARDPRRAQSLLPWRDVEALVSLHGFHDIEVMKNGMVIPPQLYEAESNMSTLHDVLVQGASIIVSRIHLKMAPIQWLATAVERELGLEVGVNAYCSFSAGGAFRPHWDRHDVLVVQVHGTKVWRIWDATVDSPIGRSVDARHDITAAPCQELQLSPGDVLYIPRGEPHAAAVSGGASAHLSLGIETLKGVDVVLNHLNAAAGRDEFLRADLPPRGATVELRDHQRELRARLHRLVDDSDLEQLLEEDAASRPPVPQVSLAPGESGTDVLWLALRRRIPLPERAEDEAAQPVTIGGAEYLLSAAAVDVLRRLFARDGQSRQDLLATLGPLHPDAAVANGLRELSRLGFLRTDPESDAAIQRSDSLGDDLPLFVGQG